MDRKENYYCTSVFTLNLSVRYNIRGDIEKTLNKKRCFIASYRLLR
jgi:hypothetical protein